LPLADLSVQIFELPLLVKNTIKNNAFLSTADFSVYNNERAEPEKG
jgi:hypothetical protein